MNNISKVKNCTACGACVNICPVEAVSIKDALFYDTQVDENKCIECGKCVSVCPQINLPVGNKPLKAAGGWTKNAQDRALSSSGGAFTLVSDYIISKNGAVFGAVFSQDKKSVVFGSYDDCSLDEIRRSKYVESNTGKTFSEIKNILETGRFVLFCGTPCQAAGLSNFLGKDYDNLIICDFSCGGLPSHKIYKDYIEFLEKKNNSAVKSVNFRPKKYGWSVHQLLVNFENGKKYSGICSTDPYFYAFLNHLSIRENCFDCPFNENHLSDVTLADYWKYTDCPDIKNDGKGISLITANTQKGIEVLEKIKDKMNYYDLDTAVASYNFKKYEFTAESKLKREKFLKEITYKDINTVACEFGMRQGITAKLTVFKAKIRFIFKNW